MAQAIGMNATVFDRCLTGKRDLPLSALASISQERGVPARVMLDGAPPCAARADWLMRLPIPPLRADAEHIETHTCGVAAQSR